MKTDIGLGEFFSAVLPYLSFPCQIFTALGVIFVIAGLLSSSSKFSIGFFFISISFCFYYWSKQESGVFNPCDNVPFYKEICWGNIFAFIICFIVSILLGLYIYITNSAVFSFIQTIFYFFAIN